MMGTDDADPVETLGDLGHGRRGLVRVHGHSHELAPGAREGRYLFDGSGNVRRVGVGHGLHDDGMPGSDGHAPDRGGHGLASYGRRHRGNIASDGVTRSCARFRVRTKFWHAVRQPALSSSRAAITAVATYVPERTVTNAELATRLDTSDEWITSRTGIRERRIGAPGETTSTMGSEAVRRLMAARGLGNSDVGALIVATVTPDMMFPATACLIQDQVGLRETWGFDLSAACSGFLYALTTGAQIVAAGVHQRVIVVGADLMSSIIDPLDRTTAVLFGDGAGAVLLEAAEPGYGSWTSITLSMGAVGRSY